MSNIVKVKLSTKLWVHGGPRNKGEVVELPEFADDGEPFAELFGEIVSDDTPVTADPASGRTFGGLEDTDPETFS